MKPRLAPGLATAILSLSLLLAALPANAQPREEASLPCLGEHRPLAISSGMPYTPVRVQRKTGWFVVDLGADGSAISPSTFPGGQGPTPQPSSDNRFAEVEFFGPLGPVMLMVQDHSGISGEVRQAGLIGTDLLRDAIVTLDYGGGRLHRSSRQEFCPDATLRQAGFRPLSTADYYSSDPAGLGCPAAPQTSGCPNIPTIPVRIDGAQAVAQIDTGYDDGRYPPSMNINRAFLRQLQTAGVGLERLPQADLSLSTCTGVAEPVLAYRLPAEAGVELVGSGGQAVRRLSGVTLFLKDTPAAARTCGGIGTWNNPAAQLGASFVNTGTLVVDPFSQRVWWRPASPGRQPNQNRSGMNEASHPDHHP